MFLESGNTNSLTWVLSLIVYYRPCRVPILPLPNKLRVPRPFDCAQDRSSRMPHPCPLLLRTGWERTMSPLVITPTQ